MNILFNNDQIQADVIVGQMRAHIAADEVIKGTYWDGRKGCFIGCIAHSESAQSVQDLTGLPLMVTKIAESIFEGLPDDKARKFFADMAECMARNVGKDVSVVGWKFLCSTVSGALALPEAVSVREACQPAIDILTVKAGGGEVTADAAYAAARAAADAADAAHAAADAAYAADAADAAAADAADAAAHATDAADAADAAADAADAAAHATDAADAAARAAAREEQAALLISLIDAAPTA